MGRKIDFIRSYIAKEIISDFLVLQKDLREGSKDFYLRLKLADKSGSIAANVWNNAKSISQKFKTGDVIRVKAVVISYKAQIQFPYPHSPHL